MPSASGEIRDPRTGLYTRAFFDEVIGRELERSRRHGIDLSVISAVVDLASLRASVGEQTAEDVLVQAARTLVVNVRETDFVTLWGDDEMLILLFDVNGCDCQRKLEELNTLFASWREGNGPVPVPVQIGLGGATHEVHVLFAGTLQSAREGARGNL